MAPDEILFGEQQLEILKKSNPNHDENLHLTSYKLVNFQNLIDKEKLKFKHWAGKHMPLLSIIGTTLFVVFLSFMFCCFCCWCCYCCFCGCNSNCWSRFLRRYFDESKCKIFRHKTVNSVSWSNDDRQMRGLIFSFLSNFHEGPHSECEATRLTYNYDNSRPYRSSSTIVAVDNRQAISRVDWPLNPPLG